MPAAATKWARLLLATAAAGSLFSLPSARAADFPSKAIDLYIGSAPAGSTDVLGRVLAKSLEELLGQPVVVRNTPGAGGAVMATQLFNSVPDGYSLGMTISHAYSGNPVVLPGSTDYAVGDFTHLASVSKGQCALVTNSQKPYQTFTDLMAAARRGEQPVFASQSPLTRIVADYIAKIADVQFKVITVQGGGEMMQTILGGHADFGFSGGPHVDHVAAGEMRVLAAVEDARLATSPNVPTLKELGYDIASCAMFVVSAPPKLPDNVKKTLTTALKAAIQSPEMKSLIKSLKYPEYYLGPDEVTKALQDEADSLARAVARINDVATDVQERELSPTFMPYVAAAFGAAALALMLIARLAGGRIEAEQASMSARSWLFICLAAAVLAAAFTLMDLYGYFFGASAIVAGFMALARAKLWIIVGAGILFPVALWLLFDKLLGFPLP
jgi:tripartite-type tricarboxylate transporter receptor subunit TctC